MPIYLVIEFDKGPTGFAGMQKLINDKVAEGYALQQAVRESTYHWVLFFVKRDEQAAA
jgi:hypothetical protein